ncbi:MAG: hypothetical protein R3A79_07590 [Nannocystaceae bacterium]
MEDTDTETGGAQNVAEGRCGGAETDTSGDQGCTEGCAVAAGGGAELLGLALALVLGRCLRRR